jgi:hypothetical protein
MIAKDSYAWLPPEDKTQFTSQIYFPILSKSLKRAMFLKPGCERDYARGQSLLYAIDKDDKLTSGQKIHKKQRLSSKTLAPLEKLIKTTPGSYDSLFYVNTIESRVSKQASLGIKILFKKSLNIKRNVNYVFQTSIFNKIHLYSTKSGLLFLNPWITFAPDNLSHGGIGLIYSSYIHGNPLGKVLQLQASSGLSPHGLEFTLDSTFGLRYKDDVMLLLQEFYTSDANNPSKIYQKTLKSQISVTKIVKNITFQLGYFAQNSLRSKLLISSGMFSGIWCFF